MTLSARGKSNADSLDASWRFAKPHTYDRTINPSGLISFATAENWLIQPELHDFISRVSILDSAYRYENAAGASRLPSAFARHINEYFDPWQRIEGTHIRVTAAATSLHDVLAFSLCAPGEGIMTSRPYYGRFEIDFWNKAGVKVVPVDTDQDNCFEEEVVKAFERTLNESEEAGVKVRAVLVVNPHNPLGRCYPKEALISLMRFCAARNLHFISDEVYALSTFANPDYPDATPFTSALSIDLTDIIHPSFVHVTYALSKDFGAAGLKVGCLITRNEELKKAATAVARFCAVSGLSAAAATAMLEDREWCRGFLSLSRVRLAEAYTYITSRLKEIGIQYMEGGNAGFFVWADLNPYLQPEFELCRGAEREQVLARRFEDNGVFLQPGEEHGRLGWFRLVSTMEKHVVEEGLRRIERTIREIKDSR